MFTNQSSNERTYAILPTDLMIKFGEICGYDKLDNEVCQILSEDLTFRLNEILNQSENFKRRTNKDCLDANDVNLMLRCYNVRSIDGSSNRISSFLDDKDESIDLVEKSKNLLKNRHHVRLRSMKLSAEYVDLKFENLDQTFDGSLDLSDELRKYYGFITGNLFQSKNNDLFERICNDLSTNDQLNDLIKCLIKYLHQNFEILSTDQNNLIKLIFVLESIIKNKHLVFKLQQSILKLIDLSLDCLLNDRFDFDFNFLIKFKYCSAKLLGSILIKYNQIINQTSNKILIHLIDLLLDKFISTKNLDIKYGIIIFFQLNPFIFFEIFFDHLMKTIDTIEFKLINKTIQTNEQQFFDLCLMSLVTCFNSIVNSDRIHLSTVYDLNKYYSRIYNVFGDSFTNQIASNDANFIKILPRKID